MACDRRIAASKRSSDPKSCASILILSTSPKAGLLRSLEREPREARARSVLMSSDDTIISGMAGRYATALFELAREANQLEQVENDLRALQGMLDESEDLMRLVRSPVFSADEQLKAVEAVMDRAGISGIAANFFKLVTQNRRLFAAPDMLTAFRALLAKHRGEVTADVTAALKLSDDQLNALKVTLKGSIGQDVQVIPHVDPTLLGGLIVKVGSRMIDSSLRTKLNNLKVAMKEVG